MATYGWRPVDDAGNPVPEQNWNTPAEWVAFPLTDPPVTGIVPGAADIALIGAGTINVSTILGSLSQSYPVTVDVTDSRTVATLGLGGVAVTGVNGSFQPTYGTPTVFPLVKVTGGTLHVSGNVIDNFTGTIAVPITGLGTETLSHTFSGGGTIDLASHATLEIGGTAGAAVIVDFTDAAGDVLTLDGINGSAPHAFAGTIDGFVQGDTLLLTALHTATHFVDGFANGTLTIADSATPLVNLATLDIVGSGLTASSFGLNAGAGGLAITIAPPPPPPPPATPALTAASDSGASHTDDITNVITPVLIGTAVAGSTVDLFDGTTLVGMGVAGGAGVWQIKSNPLAPGVHSISAEDITAAGTSTASGTLTVTIDTAAPLAPSTPAFNAPQTGGATTYNALTFTGTAEAGSTVMLFDGSTVIGSGTAAVGGGWTITPGTLAVGVHSLSADATDIAGNIGPHSVPLALTIQATNNVHWVAGSGNFATVADWQPQRVPGAADNAIIDAAGAYTVTATTSETMKTLAMVASAKLVVSAGTVAVTGGSGAGGLAGSVSISDGAALALAGAVVNSGTIAENAALDMTEILLTGAVTLSGHGTVSLSNSAANVVVGSAASTLLDNVNDSITGAGAIGAGQMALTNGGVINANRTVALTLDTGANAIVNTGTLEATAAGGLVLNSAVDQSGGGTISAAGSGVVAGFAGAILGGRLASSGGGVIRANGGAAALDGQGLHPLTNTGTVQVADGAALTLLGSIVNSGTIVAASTGDATSLVIGSPVVTVSGHGHIVLGGAGAGQITATAPNFALDNLDNAISGAGAVSAVLTNAGTVSADQAAALTLAGAVTNTGTLQATGKGGLVLQSNLVDNAGGTVQAVGAGTHVDLAGASIAGGTLATTSGGVIDTVGGGTIDGLSFGAVSTNAAISVKDNEALTVLGSIANAGTISLLAATGSSTLRLDSATVTLSGGGRISLSDNANNAIVGATPSELLVNVNNAITGAGQIGAGQMRLTNAAGGVINANQPAGSTNLGMLLLNTGAAPIVNAGLLAATNTGGLVVQSTVLNVGGKLAASGAGAHVDLAGMTIIGGTLTSSGGGVIDVIQPNTTLDGLSAGTLANIGTLVVRDNAGVTLAGTINNTGTISAAAVAGSAVIGIGGPGTTLTGKGSLLLTNNAGNAVTGSSPLSQLVNANNTIAGAGQLGAGSPLSLANAAGAVINANQPLALVLNMTGEVSNAGLMEATDTAAGNGGFVVQSSAIDNAGGTVAATGAHSHVDLSAGTIIGGTLATSGGGVIDTVGGGTLDGQSLGEVSTSAAIWVNDNEALAVLGTIANAGAINLLAVTGSSTLRLASGTVTLIGGGQISLSDNANNVIAGTAPSELLVNVNNVIFGAGQIGAGQMRLTNQAGGIINANQATALTVNTGTAPIVNAGQLVATDTGGLVVQSPVLNVGGKLLASGAGAHVDLSGVAIVGGMLTSNSGGAIDVIQPNTTLDGLSAGTLANAGSVVVEDNANLTLLGTINNTGSITAAAVAGAANIIIGGPATTLTGKGSLLLTNNAGNEVTGSSPLSQLVNVNNTIAGAGQLGNGTALALVNPAGAVINANQALALVLNMTGNVSNTGLLEATATAAVNGGLVVQNTSVDNAGGTVAATGAHAHLDLAGGTIIGGVLATSGGGVIQTAAGASGVLDGLDDGALTNGGLVRITDSTVLELLGTIVNAGTINANATTAGNTDLQIGSPVVTLTGGGTVLLSSKAGNRIIGAAAADRLVNVNNTIAGGGQLGAGGLAFSNGGTVNANAAVGLTIDLGGQAGQNLAGGLIEATAAGGLTIATGVISNAGTMLAANGGKLTFQPGAVNVANTGGVLVGGVWEASGSGSTVSLTGGAVTVDAATIMLSGAGSVLRAGDGSTFTNLEGSLGSIAPMGVLDLLAGRSYTSGKGLTDNGMVQLGGGTLALGALTIGAGAHLIGFGTVATTSKTIADAGTIEAAGGMLATASVLSGVGALRADTGATVALTGAGSAIGSVVNDSTITLAASAGLDVTTAVDAASSGIFQLNAASLLELAADQGAGDRMSFLGTGELIIDAAAKFGLNVGSASYTGPLVQHFVAGDQILLKDIAPAGLTPVYNATTGILQLSNGSANVASLAFDKTTLGTGAFHIANSGGHVLLTHS